MASWRQRNGSSPRAAFQREPLLIWTWYGERREKVRTARPNRAHKQLASLARTAAQFLLVTQNVDDLHERAGTKPEHLVHIHGEILFNRCIDPNCRYRDSRRMRIAQRLPMCPRCGSPLRPDVVWFDEELEPSEVARVENFLASGPCDLVLVVGTSAGFPYIVDWALRGLKETGRLVEINPRATPLTEATDSSLRGPATQGLRKLLST